MGERLSARETALLAGLAMAVPALTLLAAFGQPSGARFNDYHDYWLAGRLVAMGTNPYDLAALKGLAEHENLQFLVGGGYSYPPPFALAMVPLSALPFDVSAWLFSLISVVAFGLTIAWWLDRWHPAASPLRRRLAAVACGVYPPVVGSAFVGQANLLVGVLLAVGLAGIVGQIDRPADGHARRRHVLSGLALGLAAVVKVYPGAVAVPIVLARRLTSTVTFLAASGGAFAVTAAVAPHSSAGASALTALADPDPYWTNQSLNGFASRLLLDTGQTRALLPRELPVQPLAWLLIACLAVATLAVLLKARGSLANPRAFALACALVLVAATAAAPKNSFWNHVPALVAVATLLAVDAPDLVVARLPSADRVLLGAWAAGALLQVPVDAVLLLSTAPGLPTLLASAALYGLLALWLLFARRLWALADAVRASAETRPSRGAGARG